MKSCNQFLGRFLRSEGGAVAVEFVIIFPVVLMIFMTSFEVTTLSVRDLMLRRAVGLTVRDIQLSTGAPPSYEEVRAMICDRSLFTDGCEDSLRIEMVSMPLSEWSTYEGHPSCVDRQAEVAPVTRYTPAKQNELMIMRVCRLFDPLFPGAGIGRKLSEAHAGNYGIWVTTGFVAEPL